MAIPPDLEARVAPIAQLLREDNPWLTPEEATIIIMWATHFAQATPHGLQRFAAETRQRAQLGRPWGKLSPEAQELLAVLCLAFAAEETH
jgi:hypothetical protein